MSGRAMVWLLGGLALLLWQPVQAQTVVEYIHTDALGSVVAVTDQSRNVLERREYEPYGLQLTPAVQDGPGYTGHVQDAVTGLTYMQQRYYEPSLGVYLSVDPVTAFDDPVAMFHRYRYANNNPYTLIDPDGRCPDGTQVGTRICGGGAGNNVSVSQVNPSSDRNQQKRDTSSQPTQGKFPQPTPDIAATEESGDELQLGLGSGCMGGADCDFMYNQNQFLTGQISGEEFSARTQAQGLGGVVGGVIGGAVWGLPVAGTAAADAMLTSRLLGPGGRIFGNKFYAGRQGVVNHGFVRLGWSYNARSEQLQFALRIGKEHYKIFERPPP